MSVAQLFLQRVEKLGLLDDKVLGQLRKQVADAKGPVAPETLAKVLVDNGHLTVFQAKKIVGEVTTLVEQAKARAAKAQAATPLPNDELALIDDDDGLELIDDRPPAPPTPAAKKPPAPISPPPAVAGLELLEDDDGLELIDDAGPIKPAAPTPTPAKSTPAPAKPDDDLELLSDDELEPLNAPAAPKKPTQPQPTGPAPKKAEAPTQAAKAMPAPVTTPAKQPVAKPATTAPALSNSAPVVSPTAPITKKVPQPTAPQAAAMSAPALAPQVDGLTLLGDADLEVLDEGLTPLDDAESFDPLSSNLPTSAASKPGMPKPGGTGKVKKNSNPWDSALIYVGGGAVVLLTLAFVVLYYTLARTNANEAFQQAEDEFKAGSFAVANEKYERFLARHSKDPNASLARVRMGVAEMRLAVNEGRDMNAALKVIEETLARIESEERFEEARADLADMLPTVAERLAQEAKRSTADIDKATALVARADAALALTNNGAYISGNLRQLIEGKVNTVLRDVAAVKREINRDKELQATVAAVEEALAANKTKQAGETLRSFLRSYPGLDRHEQVVAAVQSIAKKEQQLVAVVEESLAPAAAVPDVVGDYVLVDRTGETKGGSSTPLAMTLQGSAYGIDSASGKVLWRHFLGMESTSQPVPVSEAPGADVLVVDRRSHELLRLKMSDGSVAWRLPLGEPCSNPAILGERVLISTASGKLIEVNSQSGASARRAVLPQGAQQSAGFDPRRPHLYQLGDHSHLFVLSSDTLQCAEVIHLGHLPGGVGAPPVATGGQVFVAVNAGADYSYVHVFSTDAEGRNLERRLAPLRMVGRIVSAPIVDGRRVYVMTDLGAVQVFDVDPANVKEPVTLVTRLIATRKEPLLGYAAIVEGNVWLGDQRMTMYELQPAKKELARRWSRFEGEVFLAPPRRLGDLLISARMRRNVGDIEIAGVQAIDGAVQWRTSVAAPIRAITTSGNTPLAVSANATAAPLDAQRPGVVDAITRVGTLGNPPQFQVAYKVGKQLVLAPRGGEPQWALLDTTASPPKVTTVKLAGNTAKLAAAAVPLDNGLLLPLDNGQVALADLTTGKALTLPYLAKLEPGATTLWQTPLAISGRAGSFVIANDRGELTLVSRKEQPQPHLSLVKDYPSAGRIGAEMAQIDDTLYVTVEKDGQYLLQPLTAGNLSPAEPLKLSSGVAFGPRRVKQGLLLATDGDGLQLLDGELKVVWKIPLEGVGISGLLEHQDELMVVTSRGHLLRISAAGQLMKRFESQRPLAGDPVLVDETLWCPGADGAAYSIPLSALAE